MEKFENAIHEMCAIENQAGEDNFLNNTGKTVCNGFVCLYGDFFSEI